MQNIAERFTGASVKRSEDPRILTGAGRYVDDVRLPGMLHAAFVRSPFAHARITSIDVAEARKAPGVIAVLTGEELERAQCPGTGFRRNVRRQPANALLQHLGHRQGPSGRRPRRADRGREPLPGRGCRRAGGSGLRGTAGRDHPGAGTRPRRPTHLRGPGQQRAGPLARRHLRRRGGRLCPGRPGGAGRTAPTPPPERADGVSGRRVQLRPRIRRAHRPFRHPGSPCRPHGIRRPARHAAGQGEGPGRGYRRLVRAQARGGTRGHRLRRRLAPARPSRPVDRGPNRESDRIGSGPGRELRGRGGDIGARRHPRPAGEDDHRHRGLPRHGRHAARNGEVDDPRPVQDRRAVVRIHGGDHQQGQLHRLPRPVGLRDVGTGADDRPGRQGTRDGAPRGTPPQRGHAR